MFDEIILLIGLGFMKRIERCDLTFVATTVVPRINGPALKDLCLQSIALPV